MLVKVSNARSVVLNVLPDNMDFNDVDSQFLEKMFKKNLSQGGFIFGAPIVKIDGVVSDQGSVHGVTFKRNDKNSVKDAQLKIVEFNGHYSISSKVMSMAYSTQAVDTIDVINEYNVSSKLFEAPSVNSILNRHVNDNKVNLHDILQPVKFSNVDAYQALAVNYIYNNSLRTGGWITLSKLAKLNAMILQSISDRVDVGAIAVNLDDLEYDMLGIVVPRTLQRLNLDERHVVQHLLEKFFENDNSTFTRYGVNTYASPFDAYWREGSITIDDGRIVFGNQSGYEMNMHVNVNIENIKLAAMELLDTLNAATSFLFGTRHHTYVHHCTGMLLLNNTFFSIEEYGQ